jgi:parallel beta-helix repeat protein
VTVGANDGGLVVQGYSSTVGDGGRATIDFTTTTGALWTNSASKILYADLIWVSSATSGTGSLFVGNAAAQVVYRCVAHGARNSGFAAGNSGYSSFIEDEAYDCNKANSGSTGGFSAASTTTPSSFVRCISHDNTGGNVADGFFCSGENFFQNCIADSNTGSGFNIASSASVSPTMAGCDAYNNTVDGIKWQGSDGVLIENCNLVKNGGWGINVSAVVSWGLINNCGFGTGSQVNGSGTSTVAGSLIETGDVSYASGVTPWVDPANGDFRINLAAANFAGRGAFTQTASSYAGTVAFPDIGAAQSKTGVGGTFNKETSGGYSQ